MGEESQRDEPVVNVFDADRLDIDAMKTPRWFRRGRVLAGDADVIGDVGVLGQDKRRKIRGVKPRQPEVSDGLAVGDTRNASREGRIVDRTRGPDLLPLHLGGLLHALWYPPV